MLWEETLLYPVPCLSYTRAASVVVVGEEEKLGGVFSGVQWEQLPFRQRWVTAWDYFPVNRRDQRTEGFAVLPVNPGSP